MCDDLQTELSLKSSRFKSIKDSFYDDEVLETLACDSGSVKQRNVLTDKMAPHMEVAPKSNICFFHAALAETDNLVDFEESLNEEPDFESRDINEATPESLVLKGRDRFYIDSSNAGFHFEFSRFLMDLNGIGGSLVEDPIRDSESKLGSMSLPFRGRNDCIIAFKNATI